MNVMTARDHIASVDRILRTADRTLHLPPITLVIWGVFGMIVHGLYQARASGLTVPSDGLVHLPLILVAIGLTVWAGRQSEERETLVDNHAGITFGVVIGVLLIVNFTAQHTVVPLKAMTLFWSAGFSIPLLVVGIQASRPLLCGGVALVAAIAIASFVPAWFDGVLALGWAAGLVAPGIVLLWGTSHGRTAAV